MKKTLITIETLLSFFILRTSARAITINLQPDNKTEGSVAFVTNPGKLITNTISVILIVATLAAFLYLVQGGFRWITSGGDKAGVDGARNQIQAALLGLFIVFAAWAVMLIVQAFFGINIFGGNVEIPTISGE